MRIHLSRDVSQGLLQTIIACHSDKVNNLSSDFQFHDVTLSLVKERVEQMEVDGFT